MDFEDTIEEQAESSFWDAHLVLDAFSKTGDPGVAKASTKSLTVEQAALRVIALCARDTYRLKPQPLSSFARQNALADEEIIIAGITMGRHDIGLHDEHRDAKPSDVTKTLRFEETDNLVFTSVNRGGEPEYDKDQWEADRLKHIDRCLDQGANIICLGEFDYPPQQTGADDESFDQEVYRKINAKDFPVFVLAGSRHDYVKDGATCHNVARIIVNDKLNDAPAGHTRQSIFKHKKVVPAAKVGERLTPPDGIGAEYYDTNLGRIAVLICVDAYNPTVMFSLFDPQLYKRDGPLHGKSDKLDFILVPAYNFSSKLYYSCQVLSMLCRCTVLLVDACNHWAENGDLKREEVELFFNGRSFSDRTAENDEIGSSILEDENVNIWRLKRNFLRAVGTEISGGSPTPSFDALGNFLEDTRNK